jgi:hypothetical protein
MEMLNKHKVQVADGYYARKTYNTLERFISYYYQSEIILGSDIESILEIGGGSGLLAEYLKGKGLKVSSCDFDARNNPDIISDVRHIDAPNKSYDAVCAFQVLEHIPFEDFDQALSELQRISRKYVFISLPCRSTYLEFVFKFPGIRKIFKRNFFDFVIRYPLKFGGFETSGQHYWEIDRKQFALSKVREALAKRFKIVKGFSPVLNKYHYFFILEVK